MRANNVSLSEIKEMHPGLEYRDVSNKNDCFVLMYFLMDGGEDEMFYEIFEPRESKKSFTDDGYVPYSVRCVVNLASEPDQAGCRELYDLVLNAYVMAEALSQEMER